MKNEDINNNNNDQELGRKRKNSNQDFQITRYPYQEVLDDQDETDLQLTLSLSFRPTKPRRALSVEQPIPPPPLPLPPPLSVLPHQLSPSHPLYMPTLVPEPSRSTPPVYHRQEAGPSRRVRRSPAQVLREGKSDIVPAPFPWATTHRATVHSLNYLVSKQIVTVTGDVQCKRCENQYEMEYNLKEKFFEVGSFIANNKNAMRDRAPIVWMNPGLPKCRFCGQENSAKPIISEKKKAINWLFLLLGQMLGCCTLEQLKYFCKHTKNHRTGAKDRVLYLTYLGLCKQLDPDGPFDR
ncbi:hypothetical protein SLA2020_262350 [Shorea laevis]